MSREQEALVEAYEKEEELYGRIHQLVRQQVEVVSGRAGPHKVMQLCHSVEKLLEEISDIEDRIGPVKKRWLKSERDLPPQVDATLERIQTMIGTISEMQTEVRRHLRRCERRNGNAAGEAGAEAKEAAYRSA